MKPGLLGEMLFVKDGPLTFFGVTAPLRKPMRELMQFLGVMDIGRPIIHLVGLEKSGAFVEHAALIEPLLKPGQMLVLDYPTTEACCKRKRSNETSAATLPPKWINEYCDCAATESC